MLTDLRIKNLALVNDLAIQFGPGYNSITGETHLVENYFQRRDKELTSSFLCFGTRSARSRSIV